MVRSIPKPVPFLVFSVATVLLTIFLGAWAVSADIDERDRNLSFAVARGGSPLGVGTSDSYEPAEQGNAGSPEEGDSKADSWWGKAVLKACPFH